MSHNLAAMTDALHQASFSYTIRLTRQTAVCMYLHVTGRSEEALVLASWLLTDSPASTVARSQ